MVIGSPRLSLRGVGGLPPTRIMSHNNISCHHIFFDSIRDISDDENQFAVFLKKDTSFVLSMERVRAMSVKNKKGLLASSRLHLVFQR